MQENLQNVRLSMLQKINKKEKNQNCDENKIHVSHNENEKNFNRNNLFVCFNFKKYYNLNRKEHKMKNEQIIEKTSF